MIWDPEKVDIVECLPEHLGTLMKCNTYSFLSQDAITEGGVDNVKGGWPGRKCLTMHTIMVANFKLWTRSPTNSMYNILPSQCQRWLYCSVYDGWYSCDFLLLLSYLWQHRCMIVRLCYMRSGLVIQLLILIGIWAVHRQRKTRSISFIHPWVP